LETVSRAVVGLVTRMRKSDSETCCAAGFTKFSLGTRSYVLEICATLPQDGRQHWIAMASDTTEQMREALRAAMSSRGLTQREMEVCGMVAGGLTNREIADRLFISELTVKDHVKSILDKLEVSGRSQLASKLLGF
jgi:DNA-binding NarL/FixJ family response regulator